MIKDLENEKFKIVIVKDLSRFGRDYIESGKYLQPIISRIIYALANKIMLRDVKQSADIQHI